MSLFDALMQAANGVIRGVYGDPATWSPSTGGPIQTGAVLFRRPTDPESMEFDDYLDSMPAIEYHAGTFTGLYEAVNAGNDEVVTVQGVTYPVQSVAVIEDGRTYRAILGEAAPKQAREVAGSDKAIKLVVDTVPSYNPATQKKPAAVRSTLVDFGKACTAQNISVEKSASPGGTVEAGDLALLMPAALVTEAQLRTAGALLLYGTQEMDIVRIDPHGMVQGTVVEWRVTAKYRAVR